MNIRRLHEWAVSTAQARDMQSDLSRQVRLTPMGCRSVTVAELDCTFSRDGNHVFAVAVVLALPGLDVIESAHVVMPVRFPNIPGLLSFREASACLEVYHPISDSGTHTPGPPDGREDQVSLT